jgi:hypothetical protein
MSFLPPPTHPAPQPPPPLSMSDRHGLLSLVYNKYEPLGVNSETRIDNEETIRTEDKHSSIYEDVSRLKFTNHLDQCSTSLARLVDLINNNKSLNNATELSENNYPNLDESAQVYNDLTYNDLLTTNHEDEVTITTTANTREDLYSKIGAREPAPPAPPPLGGVGFRDSIESEIACLNTFNKNMNNKKLNINNNNNNNVDKSLYAINPSSLEHAKIVITKLKIVNVDTNDEEGRREGDENMRFVTAYPTSSPLVAFNNLNVATNNNNNNKNNTNVNSKNNCDVTNKSSMNSFSNSSLVSESSTTTSETSSYWQTKEERNKPTNPEKYFNVSEYFLNNSEFIKT